MEQERCSGQIFTIGYGTKSLEDFLSLLDLYRVQFLIDVRTSPYSKYKPEFSQDALRQALCKKHIKYVFMGSQIGGRPADDSCYDEEGKVDYSRLEKRPYFASGIERLIKAHSMGYRICLMCSEEKPEDCHRSKLIGKVLDCKGLPLLHIVAQKKIITQSEVMELLTKGQITLFSDPLKSRKSYLKRTNP